MKGSDIVKDSFYIVLVFGSKRLEFGAKERYAKYLELGTSKMVPREFLKQTVKKLDKQTQINMFFLFLKNIQIKKERKRINQAIKAKRQ